MKISQFKLYKHFFSLSAPSRPCTNKIRRRAPPPNPRQPSPITAAHRILMSLPRFRRPNGGSSELSPNLYVANCGPAVGLSFELIASVFGRYGEVIGVYAADESGTRVIVSFDGEISAESAMKALDGRPCPHLGDRFLHIRYSVHSSRPVPMFLRKCFLCSFAILFDK